MDAGEAREKISSALRNVKEVSEDDELPAGILATAEDLATDLEMLESELQDLEEDE